MNLRFSNSSNQSLPFPDEVPIVIIHPGVRSIHPFLRQLLDTVTSKPIFVTVTHAATSATELNALLGQALNEQFECGLPAQTDLDTCLKALATSLRYRLLIEGFDLVKEPDSALWLHEVTPRLPAGCQVILSGRRLSKNLLNNAELKGKMAFFPVDPDQMQHDYIRQPSDHVLLEVFGFGTGRAFVNGELIAQWDGMLPYTLFFYMVDRGMTTRDEIFKTFWPNLSIREATNVFHVTKRKVNELLGFDLTAYWSGFYRISPNVEL